jgi:hypothetical protein
MNNSRKKRTALRKRSKRKQIGTAELQLILMEAVGAEYHKDPTRAGLVVATMSDGSHYLSIVRYAGSFGEGKQVVMKETGTDFDATLRALAKRWHTAVTPPPVVDLVKKLGAALA